jgi:Uma2 family endonuclease
MNPVATAPRLGDLRYPLQINGVRIDLPYTIRVHGVTEEMFDELVDDDTKAELIDGVMIVHSPATIEHDDVTGFVRALMDLFTEEKGLGKVLGPDSLVHLATCRRFGPDGYFVRKGRVPKRRDKQFEGAPDLVLETLSPSNRDIDLDDKRPAYREAGVQEIWFVDPKNQQVIIDRKRGKRYREQVTATGRVSSDVLDGFWIDVDWLWADPLPRKVDCLRAILGTD